jgi:hypothetical protein
MRLQLSGLAGPLFVSLAVASLSRPSHQTIAIAIAVPTPKRTVDSQADLPNNVV